MTAARPAGPLVTVVIVNFNGERLLGPCLRAVRASSLPADRFDVWVVDNASTDRSVELVRTEHPEVRLVQSDVNRGFAGGNNLALRQLGTPFVALLNSDAVCEPDWLANLLAPFDEPGADRLAAVTSKILFLPRYLRLRLRTGGFRPGGADPRTLGVRVHEVSLAGRPVTDRLLWERLAYGPEGVGGQRFWWTRPEGELLVPVDDAAGARLAGPLTLRVHWAAERAKPVLLAWDGGAAELVCGDQPGTAEVQLPAGRPLLDVINNAGSVVYRDGYGADRGYQQVDVGQFDEPTEVFAACGAGVALRTTAGRDAGWFDDDFFLYYEDTDLAWRLRAAGWAVRYQPKAVLRHVHSATAEEFSPTWSFHVDRNRLLMLTKDATAGLAARQVGRYLLTTGSMGGRAALRWAGGGGRPAVRPLLLRGRVLASYARLLPATLRRRRVLGRSARVPRAELQRWLVPR